MADEESPLTPSSDYAAMAPYWTMVDAILHGVEALRALTGGNAAGPHVPYANLSQLHRRTGGKGSPYLPQYPLESDADYELRRCGAPLTNIYADVSSNLSAKPFSEKCDLDDGEPENLKGFAEDIDGQGNNLHVFASTAFKSALDKALHWILVEYTKVPPGATLADERGMGARPYWVHIPAARMIAVYSVFFQGKEVFVHARISEPAVKREGYKEYYANRVREFNREQFVDAAGNLLGIGPATWRVLEEQGEDDKKTWVEVENGEITLGFIPLVAVIIGKRDGTTWRVDPVLHNIAHMQITSFQRQSDLQYAGIKTANPILVGEGIPAPTDGTTLKVTVGPNAVLLAPPGMDGKNGTWKYIEIAATSLTYLAGQLDKLHTEMRDLGMQPLTTSNLTVITTANVSAKAHNEVQKWALGLKDALEQAWKITCQWLKEDRQPVVKVHTDFGVELESGKEVDALLKGEQQGIFSKRTVQDEFKRRNIVSDDFDPDEEAQRLAEEQQGQELKPERMIDPVTGQPVVVTPQHGEINPPPPQLN